MPCKPDRIETFRAEDPPGVKAPGSGVTVHWHLASGDGQRSRRGIVLLPILAGDYTVSRTFARHFAAQGFQCLRFERRADWLDAQRAPEVLGVLLDQYVEDVRRGIGRASCRERVCYVV